MRHLLFFFTFLLYNFELNAQIEVKFIDQETKQPIANIVCSYKGLELGVSNQAGIAVLPKTTQDIEIQSHHYEKLYINTGLENKTVYLFPRKMGKSVREVLIKNEQNPYALSLVKKMIANKDLHHINTLESYRQIVYSKMVIDKKEDSSKRDTAKIVLDTTLKAKKMEKDTELENYMKDNTFFVWERLFEHKHTAKQGEKVLLLSSNMSGFKLPIYEILADMHQVNRYPRAFRNNTIDEWMFSLEDSTVINGRKTYLFQFYTKRKYRTPRSISGTFQIDAVEMILTKFIGGNKENYFEYNYKIKEGRYYTDNFYLSMVSNMFEVNGLKTAIQITQSTREFNAPHTFASNEFKGNEYEISRDLLSPEATLLLNKYRKDSLTKREQSTFVALDTIFKQDNMENKLKLFLALRKGEVKLGKINFGLFKLFDYNDYEGFRIQAKMNTNETFSKTWNVQSHLAYGIKDKEFKYGLGASYLVSYEKNAKLGFYASNDVAPWGRSTHFFESGRFDLNHLSMGQYYKNLSFSGYYSSDINRYLEGKIGVAYQSQKALFPYTFNSNISDKFEYLTPSLSFHFYPKTKKINTPEGKYNIEKKPTFFHLTAEQGIPLQDFLGTFFKAQMDFQTQIKSSIGKTSIHTNMGYILGSTPIFNNFEGMGLAFRNMQSFGLASHDGFMTMPSGSFYSDKQVSIFARHILFSKKLTKRLNLNPTLVYSALWGDMRDKSQHNIAFQTPNKLYQEGGLELRNLILGFGIGSYYRIGAYQENTFSKNIAFRLIFEPFY